MQGKSRTADGEPLVYIVTPVFNRIELTQVYLQCLRKITYGNARTVIVDDGSSDGTADVLARDFPEVTVLHGDGNLWWAGGTNMGVEYALAQGADYILTINNDSVFEPDFLEVLVRTAAAHPKSIVGCRIHHLHDKNLIWALGGFMDWGEFVLFNLHYAEQPASVIETEKVPDPFEVELLCGNGALFPADCFREAGLYDNKRFPQYHSDSEMCLRARKRGGYRTLVAMGAVLYNDSANIGGSKVMKVWDQLFSIRSHFNARLYFRIIKYCPGGFWRRMRMRFTYLWMFSRIILRQVFFPWVALRFRVVGTIVRKALALFGLELRPDVYGRLHLCRLRKGTTTKGP